MRVFNMPNINDYTVSDVVGAICQQNSDASKDALKLV